MLGQINSSQITKTITWVFIRVNPLGQKLAIFLSSLLSQSDLLVSLCFFYHGLFRPLLGFPWKNSSQK